MPAGFTEKARRSSLLVSFVGETPLRTAKAAKISFRRVLVSAVLTGVHSVVVDQARPS